MFAYLDKAFRKIMVNIHFLQPNNFPAFTLKEGIFYFIQFLSLGKRMPIVAINFYYNMILGQHKITSIFPNTIFSPKRNSQLFKGIFNNQFWISRALAIRGCPSSETLPRAKTEFLKFGWFHPDLLPAPFAPTELAFPKRMRSASNSSFEFMGTFTATKPPLVFEIRKCLIEVATELANKYYFILFIPRRLTPACFVSFENIYFGLGYKFFRPWQMAVNFISTKSRTKLTFANLDLRRYSLEFLATIKAIAFNFVSNHIYIIAQINKGYKRGIRINYGCALVPVML